MAITERIPEIPQAGCASAFAKEIEGRTIEQLDESGQAILRGESVRAIGTGILLACQAEDCRAAWLIKREQNGVLRREMLIGCPPCEAF